MTREEKAFGLGFMVSREGFNGECDYQNCSPSGLFVHHHDRNISQYLLYIEGNPEFVRLRELAMARVEAEAVAE